MPPQWDARQGTLEDAPDDLALDLAEVETDDPDQDADLAVEPPAVEPSPAAAIPSNTVDEQAVAQTKATRPWWKAPGWVPKQHGAWAMLLTPFAIGASERARANTAGWWLVSLLLCWVLGYFAFNAASLWLRSTPRRRPERQLPVLVYAGASAAFGILTATVVGWSLLWWIIPFLPLLGATLWLVTHGKERSVASGGLTVAAASLMTLVARFPDPTAFIDTLGAPTTERIIGLDTACFGYFFGTILYVKTMIRERGSRAWLNASVAWHTACTAVAAAAVLWGGAGRRWPLLFLVLTLRAWAMPMLAAKRPIKPVVVGTVEAAFTLALLGASLL